MGKLKIFWNKLGPGLVVGAADNDPSAIATYAIVGARAGHAILWTMLYILPLMIVVQQMSARIGLSSSCGLAGNLKRHYPKYLLFSLAGLLLIANIFNIGANISAMGAAIELIMPRSSLAAAAILAITAVFITTLLPFRKVVVVFKWLSLSLLAYVLAGLITISGWPKILINILIPQIYFSKEYFILILAVFGTTISPYLVVWQASEEAEEKKLITGQNSNVCEFRAVTRKELVHADQDTSFGMIFSNFISVFIIALTASLLFNAGINNIHTLEEIAGLLQPLAGKYAHALFSFGLISSGLLAIPVLAGSAAYLVSEMFGWEASLSRPFSKAPQFHLILIISTLLGLLITFLGISPIQALFYTAILQGLAGPVLIAVITHMANNPKIVGGNRNSRTANFLAGLAMIVLLIGSAVFLYTIW